MTNQLIDRCAKLSTYQIINSIFIVVIIAMIGYAVLFSPERSKHPVPSSHTRITGEETASTGMSRAFSSIVRLNFSQARDYNPYSIQVFAFFLIQLFLRIFVNAAYNSGLVNLGIKQTVIIDAMISGILFIVFFEPFWREMVGFLM